jgi:hypothetical protein
VIVLASAYSGAGWLRTLLDGHPDLACASGTGILPLCQQAMAAWRSADGRAARSPSLLAVTATRALASTIITSVLAREGKRRWCEVATTSAQAAEAFLRLYPATKFLCVYRACPAVIRAALDAAPWGLADPVFEQLTEAQHQTVETITSFLGVTAQPPGHCIRSGCPVRVILVCYAAGHVAEDRVLRRIGRRFRPLFFRRTWRSGDQAQFSRPGDRLSAGGRAKLGQEVADVLLDGI